jgi:hypothetical protein
MVHGVRQRALRGGAARGGAKAQKDAHRGNGRRPRVLQSGGHIRNVASGKQRANTEGGGVSGAGLPEHVADHAFKILIFHNTNTHKYYVYTHTHTHTLHTHTHTLTHHVKLRTDMDMGGVHGPQI